MNPIERLYNGKCTVTEYRDQKDPITKVTRKQEIPSIIEQPCRLSYKNILSTKQDGAPIVKQSVKLFISPNVQIKPGSKITVTQNGITRDYQSSGEPAVYSTHQEIVLELFKGWA